MSVEPDIARIAQTIGDPTRIRMLTLLMDGRALTAKELAYGAGIGPATGTVHLRKLMDVSLVTSTSQGRHKYFRLASVEVARTIESLMALAVPQDDYGRAALAPIRAARFCYDHLAGRVAIRIVEALKAKKLIAVQGKEFVVSRKGEKAFDELLKIDVAALSSGRRKFAPLCLDWSERKDHIGGALGAALAHTMLENNWVTRKPDTRVATVTRGGSRALAKYFDIDWK